MNRTQKLLAGIVSILVITAGTAWYLKTNQDIAPVSPAEQAVAVSDLVVGTDREAKAGLLATVHYNGQVQGGLEFESTRAREKGVTIKLGNGETLVGLDQAITGMKVGGKRRVIIPPELGYGSRTVGDVVKPNSTLVYEIDLVNVEDPPVEIPGETYTELKTKDLATGKGAKAAGGSVVKIHYRATLSNGKDFEDTYPRQTPVEVTLGAGMLLQGVDQGIIGMQAGGKREIKIPPELGYGSRSVGGLVPPNSSLIYTVELLEISKAPNKQDKKPVKK